MPGKVGISLGSVALCVALSHCAGDTKVAKAPETIEATSEEKTKPQPEGGEGGAPPAEEAKASEHADDEPEHALVTRVVEKNG